MLTMLRLLTRHRDLLYMLSRRDVTVKYKQSIMGFLWAILMPLLNTAIFSLVFMRVAPVQTRVPYPLFAFCGLLAWNFTASALRGPAVRGRGGTGPG